MTIQNVIQVDQEIVKETYRFAVKNGHNVLCIGPAGAGKTIMAFQVCAEEKFIPIYWNLSVSERVDVQGLPKVDGDVSVYATPHQLPTNNKYSRDKSIIKKFIDSPDFSSIKYDRLKSELRDRLDKFIKFEEINSIKDILKYVSDEDNVKLLNERLDQIPEDTNKYVLIFDEADKAPTEVLQPLLEILQFKTINGTKLNISSCILTSNLPDEHVHSEQISHAITNRCLTIELKPELSKWLPWAKENNVHPLVLGFLSKKDNSSFFCKRPKSSDIHLYAYCTPRSWEKCSDILWDIEKENVKIEQKDHFKYVLTASAIGDEAAKAFKVWTDCYSKLDPLIDYIYENGNSDIIPALNLIGLNGGPASILDDLPFDEQLICAIGVCYKYMAYIENEDDYSNIKNKTDAVFAWLYTQNSEAQATAIQSTLKGPILEKKKVSAIQSAHKIFLELRNSYERNKI